MQCYRFKRENAERESHLPSSTNWYSPLRKQALPDHLQWGAQTKQARYIHIKHIQQAINK
jgi:hypothetical protein